MLFRLEAPPNVQATGYELNACGKSSTGKISQLPVVVYIFHGQLWADNSEKVAYQDLTATLFLP